MPETERTHAEQLADDHAGDGLADLLEEIDQDLPDDVDADFVPLDTAGEDRRDIDPFQYDSLQAEEAFDAAVQSAAHEREEEAIQHFLRAAKIAETAHEWQLAAVACQRVGDFLFDPRPPHDLERALRMYRRAIAAYENCGLFAEARQLAYRVMYVRMRRGRELGLPLTRRLELHLYWLIAGFGYSPTRVVVAAAVFVLFFALVYWMTQGVLYHGEPVTIDLFHAIYFSGATFATIGYGDFVPAPKVQMIALAEGFVGVLTMGLFVAVLAARVSRT